MFEVRLKEVRSSLELTDGCIIDGDQDSITFAIKVSRATLRANHHFLVAASEAATDARPPPALSAAPVQTVSRWGRRFAKRIPTVFGLAASLSFLGAVGMWSYYAIVPAVAYQSLVPDQATIASGSPLTLLASAKHNRACHITYHRAVTREGDGDLVFSDSHPAQHQGVSNGYETTAVMIPLQPLEAGYYALSISGDFDCGTLDSRTRQITTIHFTVQ